MGKTENRVYGLSVPPPRATAAGALWLASVLSVPVFVVLAILELLWRIAV